MTSVANTVAMTTLAVHTLQPLIFYTHPPKTPSPRRDSLNELLLHIPARRTTGLVEDALAPRDDEHGHQPEDAEVQVAAALEVS